MTDSQGVFERLREAAPTDSITAKCYFLGDGITAVINLEADKPDTGLDLTLVDEKSSRTMTGATVIRSTVSPDEVVTEIGNLGFHDHQRITRPVNLLDKIADALALSQSVDDLLDWESARRDSLRTPSIEGIDVSHIRTIMASLVEVPAE